MRRAYKTPVLYRFRWFNCLFWPSRAVLKELAAMRLDLAKLTAAVDAAVAQLQAQAADTAADQAAVDAQADRLIAAQTPPSPPTGP
jgi:hypothetical protein